MVDATASLEAYIEKLRANPSASEPLPIESWWSSSESDVDTSSAAVESDMTR